MSISEAGHSHSERHWSRDRQPKQHLIRRGGHRAASGQARDHHLDGSPDGVGGTEQANPKLEVVADLYREAAPALTRFVSSLGLDPHDADDVVAEAFSTLWSMSDERFASIANLRSYLFVVARHAAYRRFQAQRKVTLLPHEDLDEGIVMGDEVVAAQSAQLSRQAYSALPEAQQRLLWSTLIERRSSRAIADELGTSISNVTTQAQRARLALRQAYLLQFLDLTSRTCTFDPETLARNVLATASRRQQRTFRDHLLSCEECRRVVAQAAEEMQSSTIHGITFLGALALGGDLLHGSSSNTADPSGRVSASSLHRSGLVRVALAAVGILLAIASPGLQLAEGHLPLDVAGTSTEVIGAHSAPGVDITASPANLTIAMPAPGDSTTLTARVTNHATDTVGVAIEVQASADPSHAEEPLLAFEAGRHRLHRPLRASAFSGKRLYVGQLAGGETLGLQATAIRLRSDIDQSLSTTMRIRFIAGIEVPQGTRPGDLLPERPGSAAVLPDTGMPVHWAVPLAAIAMLVAGTMMIRSARRRERRWVRSMSSGS